MGGLGTCTTYPQRCVRFCSAPFFGSFGRYNYTAEAMATTEGGYRWRGKLWARWEKGICFFPIGAGVHVYTQVWWDSLPVVGVVAKAPGYVWLVSINFFSTELKLQTNLLPGNPSHPTLLIVCCWGAWPMQLGIAEEPWSKWCYSFNNGLWVFFNSPALKDMLFGGSMFNWCKQLFQSTKVIVGRGS